MRGKKIYERYKIKQQQIEMWGSRVKVRTEDHQVVELVCDACHRRQSVCVAC